MVYGQKSADHRKPVLTGEQADPECAVSPEISCMEGLGKSMDLKEGRVYHRILFWRRPG